MKHRNTEFHCAVKTGQFKLRKKTYYVATFLLITHTQINKIIALIVQNTIKNHTNQIND